MVSLALKPGPFRAIRFRPLSDAGLQFSACVLAIALYTIAYLRLPHQPKYLIPLLPFVILLLDHLLGRRIFLVVCSMFIASSFLTIGRTGIHAGPIVADHAARQHDMAFVERVVSTANGLHERVTIVAGSWQPKIHAILSERPPGMAEYVYSLDAASPAEAEGAVYYLPGIREYNRALTGTDLEALGAKLLLSLPDGLSSRGLPLAPMADTVDPRGPNGK
jgi:hypothetical protein